MVTVALHQKLLKLTRIELKQLISEYWLIYYTDGESTAIGPQASSPDKEEEKEIKQAKPGPVKPQRIPSTKASKKQPKRSSPVKEENQTDSESERLQLPAIRPQSVSSSVKSPYLSSVKVVTPKGTLYGHSDILT